jgi:hypothetical protein
MAAGPLLVETFASGVLRRSAAPTGVTLGEEAASITVVGSMVSIITWPELQTSGGTTRRKKAPLGRFSPAGVVAYVVGDVW